MGINICWVRDGRPITGEGRNVEDYFNEGGYIGPDEDRIGVAVVIDCDQLEGQEAILAAKLFPHSWWLLTRRHDGRNGHIISPEHAVNERMSLIYALRIFSQTGRSFTVGLDGAILNGSWPAVDQIRTSEIVRLIDITIRHSERLMDLWSPMKMEILKLRDRPTARQLARAAAAMLVAFNRAGRSAGNRVDYGLLAICQDHVDEREYHERIIDQWDACDGKDHK